MTIENKKHCRTWEQDYAASFLPTFWITLRNPGMRRFVNLP